MWSPSENHGQRVEPGRNGWQLNVYFRLGRAGDRMGIMNELIPAGLYQVISRMGRMRNAEGIREGESPELYEEQ